MIFCVVIGRHPDDTPGGAELQSHLISSELASRSYDCHYLAYDSDRSTTETVDGVRVHKLAAASFRETVSRIREIDADIYYFRNWADLPLAAYTDTFVNGEVIYNISHDRQCKSRFSYSGSADSGFLENTYGRLRVTYYRSLLPVLDHVIVQTETQRELLRANWGISPPVIGNGQPIPDGEFTKEEPPIILWLASLKRWKQPDVFVKLARECTDLEARFWIIGRPSNPELAELVSTEASRIENLNYLGGCSIDESNQYIRKASVFVNTSTGEGFPNTFIQSWARKTPVVSLHSNPDGVLDENDIGFNPGDFDSMVQRIRLLANDEGLRRTLGENAYSYARTNHEIKVVVDRFEEYLADEI